MRDKTFFCQFSRQFSVIYECISSCPFTNKKMDKVDSKNINGCWVCGLHIKKKTNNFIFA